MWFDLDECCFGGIVARCFTSFGLAGVFFLLGIFERGLLFGISETEWLGTN